MGEGALCPLASTRHHKAFACPGTGTLASPPNSSGGRGWDTKNNPARGSPARVAGGRLPTAPGRGGERFLGCSHTPLFPYGVQGDTGRWCLNNAGKARQPHCKPSVAIGAGSTPKFPTRRAMRRAVALSMEGQPLWQPGPPPLPQQIAGCGTTWAGAAPRLSWVFRSLFSRRRLARQSKPMTQNCLDPGAPRLLATFPSRSGPFPCCACLLGCSGASLRAGLGFGGDARPVPRLSAVPVSLVLAIKKRGFCSFCCPGKTPLGGKPRPAARRRSPCSFSMFFWMNYCLWHPVCPGEFLGQGVWFWQLRLLRAAAALQE